MILIGKMYKKQNKMLTMHKLQTKTLLCTRNDLLKQITPTSKAFGIKIAVSKTVHVIDILTSNCVRGRYIMDVKFNDRKKRTSGHGV